MKKYNSIRLDQANGPSGSQRTLQKRSFRNKQKPAPSPDNNKAMARFLARKDCELVRTLAERDRKIAALQFELDQMRLKQDFLLRRSLEMAKSLSVLCKSDNGESPLPRYSWDAMPPSAQRLKDDCVLFGLKKPGYNITPSMDLGRGQGSQAYPILPSLRRLCGILLFPFVEVPTCGGSILLEIVAPDGQLKMSTRQSIDELMPDMPVRFSFAAMDIEGGGSWQLRVSTSDCPAGFYVLELGKEENRLPFCGFVCQDEDTCTDQVPNIEGHLFANIQAPMRKRAVIFGSGEGGLRAMTKLKFYNWDISYFVDNREEAWGTRIFGVEVKDPQSLMGRDFDLIMVASKPGQRAITEQLQGMGFVLGADFLVARL